MRRLVSKAREDEVYTAVKKGMATECIKEKCWCWKFCSGDGKADPWKCIDDLETRCWERHKNEEGYSKRGQQVIYRDPLKRKGRRY